MTVTGYPSPGRRDRRAPLRPGELLAGKYRIGQVVGAGAMGVVVAAVHLDLDRQVAIKFLYAEFAEHASGAERFRREARAAARIRNEHVARVLDIGMLEDRNIPYIVMEYLEGRDLARELGARGCLPASEAARYLLQACDAVLEAHALGIVHRDLKPANLFLAQRANGTRSIKVLDFGISKLLGSSAAHLALTDTAVLMGSPAYMSPEQLESSRGVDERADIWSLGVIAYELVAGALPFTGDSVPQLVRAIIADARVPLTGEQAALEPIVARCLCQERSGRYQTVLELRQALRAALPEPSGATPPPPAALSPERTPRGAPLGSDGAWGGTQGGRRRAWPRVLPLAALLGLIAVGSAWGLYVERRGAQRRALGLAAAPLPSPASSAAQVSEAVLPAPVVLPAPAALPAPSALPPDGVPGPTPRTPIAAVAAAPPAPGEARVKVLALTPAVSPPPSAAPTDPDAAAPPSEVPSEERSLEIPEFGGRR